MRKRPLLFSTIAFTIGIVAAIYMGYIFFVPLILLCSTAVLIYSKLIQDKYMLYILIALLIAFAIGYVRTYTVYNKNYPILQKAFEKEQVGIKGKIVSEAEIKQRSVSYIVDVSEIEIGKAVFNEGFKLMLSVSQGEPNKSSLLDYGQAIKVQGSIFEPQGQRNPYGFDYKGYLKTKGVYALMSAKANNISKLEGGSENSILGICIKIRKRLVDTINASLPEQHAALLNGMLLGAREKLPEELENDFSRCGLTHIMCVSGANISFVIVFIVAIISSFTKNRQVTCISSIIAIVFFTLLVGFSPPVARAALMGIIVVIAKMLHRKSDVYTSVAAASLVILMVKPLTLFDIGFQLSVAGTLSLIAFYKPIKKLFIFLPGAISDAAACALAAQIGVLPITLYYFNALSFVSILANILAVPITGIITILGFIAALLGLLSLHLSQFISGLNFYLLHFILFIVRYLSGLKWAVIYVATPRLWQILAYYVIAILLIKGGKLFKFKYNFACICVSVVMIIGPTAHNYLFPAGNMEVTFVDVGQGDCALVKTPEGKNILIDSGGNSGFDVGDSIVVPFLLDKGVTNLDMVILSHAHADHILGCMAILDKIQVERLVANCSYETEQLKDIIELARQKGVAIFDFMSGDTVKLGAEVLMELISAGTTKHVTGIRDNDNNSPFIFPEDKEPQKNCNNSSYVIRISYKNARFLFTGDVENEIEDSILLSGRDIRSNVLKVAHHGSAYSTGRDFIEAVAPSIAIVSVGRNTYGHPDTKGTLKRLEEASARIFRTDQDGAVIVTTNGNEICVNTIVGVNNNLTAIRPLVN